MSAVAGYGGLGLLAWRIGPWSLAYGAFAFGLATISWIGPQTGYRGTDPAGQRAARALAHRRGHGRAHDRLLRRAARGKIPWRGGLTRTLAARFTDDIRGPSVPWILFGAGAAGQLGVAVTSGHLGYVGLGATPQAAVAGYAQFLALLGECVPLAVAIAALRAYRTRLPSAWATLAVLFAGAIVAGAVAGGKTSFVVAVLAVAIPRTMTGGRIPAGLLAAAVAFFLLVVIPFNQAYRAVGARRGHAEHPAGGRRRTRHRRPGPGKRPLARRFSRSPPTTWRSASGPSTARRSSCSGPRARSRTRSPGQLAVSPVIDLIPRILWPGKPILDVGYQMSQEYYQLPPQVYTSSDITPEGDLYRHGGWVVLIAGMFLLGCGARDPRRGGRPAAEHARHVPGHLAVSRASSRRAPTAPRCSPGFRRRPCSGSERSRCPSAGGAPSPRRAGQRHRRPLIAARCRRQREPRQPGADAHPTLSRVRGGSHEGGREGRHVADGEDLADALDQVRRAAHGLD